MLYKPIRVTLRLTKSDVDIISLMEYYQPRRVVSLAVSRYLGRTHEALPLSPEISDKEQLYRSIIFHRGDDEEVYDFLAGIPNGTVGPILKRLIRHATEQCDIRPLLANITDEAPENQDALPIQDETSILGHQPRGAPLTSGAEPLKKKKRRKKRNRAANEARPDTEFNATAPDNVTAAPALAQATVKPHEPKPEPVKTQENRKPAPDSIFDLI